jgi:hypothetical protein
MSSIAVDGLPVEVLDLKIDCDARGSVAGVRFKTAKRAAASTYELHQVVRIAYVQNGTRQEKAFRLVRRLLNPDVHVYEFVRFGTMP